MAEKLLKVWDDWSAGAFYTVDDGQTPGYGHTNSLLGAIGLRHEVRPVPQEVTASVTLGAGYNLRHGFEEVDASGNPRLYLVNNTASAGRLTKVSLITASFGQTNNALDYSNPVGHPIRYAGNWYWTELAAASEIHELTTCADGVIGSDTVTPSVDDRGDGHLFSLGHQMAKVSTTVGVQLLSTDASPITGTWGSAFPVGDPNDLSLGAASLQGAAFVLRGRGLYTFNDRGRSGPVYEDLALWQGNSIKYWSMDNWKGGLVFSHPSGLFYYRTGNIPINISPTTREPEVNSIMLDPKDLRFHSIKAVGDYLYAYCTLIGSTTTGYILCGNAVNQDPTNIRWWVLIGNTTGSVDYGLVVTTTGTYSTGITTCLWYQEGTAIKFIPLNGDGSPVIAKTGIAHTYASILTSELIFPTPTRITKVVVITGGGDDTIPFSVVSTDVKAYINGNVSTAVQLAGSTVSTGRTEFTVNHENVFRYSLLCSLIPSLGNAGPTTIRRIELWGEDN